MTNIKTRKNYRMKPRYEGDKGATVRVIRADREIPGVIGGAGWWVVKFLDGGNGTMCVHQDDIQCAS